MRNHALVALALLAAVPAAGAAEGDTCKERKPEQVEACLVALRDQGFAEVVRVLEASGFKRAQEMEPNVVHMTRDGGFMRGEAMLAAVAHDGDRIVRMGVR